MNIFTNFVIIVLKAIWRKNDLHSVDPRRPRGQTEDTPMVILPGAEQKRDEALEKRQESFPGKQSIGMQSVFRL